MSQIESSTSQTPDKLATPSYTEVGLDLKHQGHVVIPDVTQLTPTDPSWRLIEGVEKQMRPESQIEGLFAASVPLIDYQTEEPYATDREFYCVSGPDIHIYTLTPATGPKRGRRTLFIMEVADDLFKGVQASYDQPQRTLTLSRPPAAQVA